jgi:hypothetical protein
MQESLATVTLNDVLRQSFALTVGGANTFFSNAYQNTPCSFNFL